MKSIYTLNTEAIANCLRIHLSAPGSREDNLKAAERIIYREGFDSAQIRAGYESAQQSGIITDDEAHV